MFRVIIIRYASNHLMPYFSDVFFHLTSLYHQHCETELGLQQHHHHHLESIVKLAFHFVKYNRRLNIEYIGCMQTSYVSYLLVLDALDMHGHNSYYSLYTVRTSLCYG